MTAALRPGYPRWRLLLWRHPESWALALSAGAWLFFIGTEALGMSLTSLSHHAHAGHNIWPSMALHWSIMIAAMMFPPLIGQIRVVAARSLWSRRNRAMAVFLAGYSAIWLVFGLVAESSVAAFPFFVPFGFLVAACWQLTPPKRISLSKCHRTMPLAPSGWRADFDCCRYGIRTAANCCISCWALMLVCAAAGHALWVLLAVTLVTWSERFLRSPRQLWLCLGLLAVAVLTCVPLLAAGI